MECLLTAHRGQTLPRSQSRMTLSSFHATAGVRTTRSMEPWAVEHLDTASEVPGCPRPKAYNIFILLNLTEIDTRLAFTNTEPLLSRLVTLGGSRVPIIQFCGTVLMAILMVCKRRADMPVQFRHAAAQEQITRQLTLQKSNQESLTQPPLAISKVSTSHTSRCNADVGSRQNLCRRCTSMQASTMPVTSTPSTTSCTCTLHLRILGRQGLALWLKASLRERCRRPDLASVSACGQPP